LNFVLLIIIHWGKIQITCDDVGLYLTCSSLLPVLPPLPCPLSFTIISRLFSIFQIFFVSSCFHSFIQKLRYGPGPHKVEVEVNFPTESLEKSWYFVIELAGVDDMPHTVYTFLQQVSNKLYDNGGYSFFANAAHVVQGGPMANHLTPNGGKGKEDPAQKFQASGYNNVVFPEYSTKLPHQKFTLGMSGRPGGPKFYINMIDNSANHGPGGYAVDGTGDPCFGKISQGFDVVEKLHAASGPLEGGQWKETEGGPVAVRSIRLLD
jgi:cyclophilin family peptidyl-prolyl cis-trans isomerase